MQKAFLQHVPSVFVAYQFELERFSHTVVLKLYLDRTSFRLKVSIVYFLFPLLIHRDLLSLLETVLFHQVPFIYGLVNLKRECYVGVPILWIDVGVGYLL